MKLPPKTFPALASLAVILSAFLSACGSLTTPSPTMDVGIFYTQAAATIALGLTQTSQAEPSVTPVPANSTPRPTSPPTQDPATEAQNTPETALPTPQPVPASPTPLITADPATAHGCYNAVLVADVTIRFAPTFNPGERFTKTWRVKNTGSCDWPRGFKIDFVSGNSFGAENTFIDQKVSAGSIADISLEMTAPNLTGVVNSNWRLNTNIGKPFGPLLNVAITLPGSLSIIATTSGSGCLNSVLISDVTIPNGAQIQPNTTFKKTWSIKNTGSCIWNRDFKITFVGGELLGADTTKIRQEVGPGASANISLNMTSPSKAGTYSSAWQLASDDGQLFGQLFAFGIVVK